MTKKNNIKTPPHNDEALKELENNGISYFDHADYKDGHIVAYKRWGRGFLRAVVEVVQDG